MNWKKLKKSCMMAITTVVLGMGILIPSISSATTDSNGGLYLGLEEFRSSSYAYKTGLNGSEKVLWKITAYDKTGTIPNRDRAIYCLRGGPGFGSTEMGNIIQKRNYTEYFDLKNLSAIPSPYKDVIPSGERYNSLIWVLEHCYVPAPTENPTDTETQVAQSYRKQLLEQAGLSNSRISDDEIDIAQQLAVWHFTNDDVYKLDATATFYLWVKQTGEKDYEAIGDKFGDGDDRNDDTIALYQYLVAQGEANKNTAPVINATNRFTLNHTNTKVEIQGQNYIVGPYRIDSLVKENYDFVASLQNKEGTQISYNLLDENKTQTNKTLKELVGKDFYLSIPITESIDGLNFKVSVTEYTTKVTYWSVNGSTTEALGLDQPVAEVVREKVNYEISAEIEYNPIFDLALRKFITKVNDTPVDPSREPQVDVTALADGTAQTAIKAHTKTPVEVAIGDTVLYTIRIYNEGNIDGYAKEITDILPEGLTLKENSTINQENGWTNPTGDKKTIVTTKLADKLINKFNGTSLDYEDVQVECTVSATQSEMIQYFKNIAEITKHSDSTGNESVTDRDSTPNNLTEEQKGNYNPGSSEQGWGYEDDDDYEELVIPGKVFDLALRKFITEVNDVPVNPSRVPKVEITSLANGTTKTAIKQHTKTPVQVENGDTILYTIRVYNEGDIDGYAKEITDFLPEGLILKADSQINQENGWTNPSGDGKTIITTKLANTLISKFNGTNLDYEDVQVECVVQLSDIQTDHSLKNIAEITVHSDDTGNENIIDRDSTPDNLTEEQKENYNPGSSEQGWGYEDDDDYEELVVPGKEFDLALRKFITSINGKDLVDEKGNYLRQPSVDITPLIDGSSTTANYRHPKDPVGVSVGDIVIYTIRIYNEGELDGYASSVTDYLPPQLEFVIDDEENFNSSQGWLIDSSLRKATTTKLAKTQIDPEENLIKAFDAETMTEPDYKDLQIKCRVKTTADLDKVITNIAEITDFTDANGNVVTDRDSEKANVNLPSDEELPDYKGNEANKSILDDENYFYKGQEDDDDFEKLILEEFDLALRKFITGVEDNPITNRVPVFTNVKDENGNYIYEHTKEPVEVETMDIVEYTIRVYNEGNIAGYAKEIKDDIPSGLEFLPEHETNKQYRWVMLDEAGNVTQKVEEAVEIRTDYLSKEQEQIEGENLIKGFDPDTMSSPDYKEVKIAFKVVAANSYEGIITNIAEITDDSDEDGNEVEDKDSVPDNNEETEDDIDKEHIKLKYFDLALRKFITAVNETEVTDRVPVFTVDEDGNFVYEHTKEPVEVENGNIVTYTLRIYNEGTQAGYASLVKDDLPEGLLFLPDNSINQEYRWIMLDEEGNVTENVEEAVSVQTDYLSKEQETQTGRDNLLDAFDKENMEQPDYRDIKIAFQVTEPNTSDRILINRAQIADDQNEEGNDVVDKDSTPDKWIEGEDDQDIEKVKVKYFDLALRKWVTQAIVIENGKETVTETGHKAEDDPEAPVKVEIPSGKLNKVVVKFRYKIRVTNEGEIAGFVKEITDYVPEGLKFEQADNPGWTEKDGVITTDMLKDTLLQPGDSAEVEIVLTWINNANNMGLKVNTAEISEDDNESDTPDIDSTPNNKVPGEDDIDDAPVILSIKTGVAPIKIEYIGLIGASIIILGAGVVFIKKFVL